MKLRRFGFGLILGPIFLLEAISMIGMRVGVVQAAACVGGSCPDPNEVCYKGQCVVSAGLCDGERCYISGGQPPLVPNVCDMYSYCNGCTGFNAQCSTNRVICDNLSVIPNSGYAPLNVTASITGHAYGSATITRYVFDFGDGVPVSQTNPTAQHSYSTAGTYFTVKGRVVDGLGNPTPDSAACQKGVNVLAMPACRITNPPQATEGRDFTITAQGAISGKTYEVYFYRDGITMTSRTVQVTADGSGVFSVRVISPSVGSWSFAAVPTGGGSNCSSTANTNVIADHWVPVNADCTISPGVTAKGVKTAIGCIPTDNLTEFLKFNLRYVFMIAGLIVFGVALVTGFTLLTSSGKPETLATAKENFVALLAGLALIVFSLILLQTIGKDILGLPSF